MEEVLRSAPLNAAAPLKELEDWDDFVTTRYQPGKAQEQFRNYRADANATVTEFYRQNHAHQTLDFVLRKKREYCGLRRGKKSIWEMAEYLNTLVDHLSSGAELSSGRRVVHAPLPLVLCRPPSWGLPPLDE